MKVAEYDEVSKYVFLLISVFSPLAPPLLVSKKPDSKTI
jgi:hypothetical protein